jgi:hypothetical protein
LAGTRLMKSEPSGWLKISSGETRLSEHATIAARGSGALASSAIDSGV